MLVLLLGLGSWLTLVWLYDHRGERTNTWKALLIVPPILLLAIALLVRSDYVLQKLAGRLVMPAGILWMILGCNAAAAWLRRNKHSGIRRTALFIGYSVIGSPLIATLMLNQLESNITPYQLTDERQFDAVFILGGASGVGPSRVELECEGDRLLLAAVLYKEGKTRMLVTSGQSIAGIGPQRDFTEETATILSQMGVPRSAIIQIVQPVNTSEELAAYAKLIADKGWKNVGLLSSAYHLTRGLRLAEANGLSMTPIRADTRGGPLPPPALALVPYGPAFADINTVFWELIGRGVGR